MLDMFCFSLIFAMQFMRGPVPASLLVLQAIGMNTVMVDVVYMQSAEQPVLFKPLPLPVRTYADGQDGFTTPFVGLIFNCADVKVRADDEVELADAYQARNVGQHHCVSAQAYRPHTMNPLYRRHTMTPLYRRHTMTPLYAA
jgi:hypothetical protein